MFAVFSTFGALACVAGTVLLAVPRLPLVGIRRIWPPSRATLGGIRLVGAFLLLLGAVVIEIGFAVDNPLPPDLHVPAIGLVLALLLVIAGAFIARFASDISRMYAEMSPPSTVIARTARPLSAPTVRLVGIQAATAGVLLAIVAIIGAIQS